MSVNTRVNTFTLGIDPNAPIGSSDWGIMVRDDINHRLRTMDMDGLFIKDCLDKLKETEVWRQLPTNKPGLTFQSWEVFCTTRPPHGFGLSLTQLKEECERRKQGRPTTEEKNHYRGNGFSPEKQGNSKGYCVARLKDDYPNIYEALQRGEYRSARQAAIAAGFVKDERFHRLPHDIEKVVVCLQRWFSEDELNYILLSLLKG